MWRRTPIHLRILSKEIQTQQPFERTCISKAWGYIYLTKLHISMFLIILQFTCSSKEASPFQAVQSVVYFFIVLYSLFINIIVKRNKYMSSSLTT